MYSSNVNKPNERVFKKLVQQTTKPVQWSWKEENIGERGTMAEQFLCWLQLQAKRP